MTDRAINPECFASHMGPWLVEPTTMQDLVASFKTGTLEARAKLKTERTPDGREESLYVVDDGLAVLHISGVMVKGQSKFEGTTNTLRTRRALRAAVADREVEAILLVIDSPGGTAAGTPELAEDVRTANLKKPIFAHIDDTGASAAYYVASQAGFISAQATSRVGSIGTVLVLEDTSRQAESDGIVIHVISTGDFKGAFADGAPISDKQIQYAQSIVDDHANFFFKAVADGRRHAGMNVAKVKAAADGRTYTASAGRDMGLIDAVQRLDATIKQARGRIAADREASEQRSNTADAAARRRVRAAAAEAE